MSLIDCGSVSMGERGMQNRRHSHIGQATGPGLRRRYFAPVYSERDTDPEAQNKTRVMLQGIQEYIAEAVGVQIVICGDWNFVPEAIEERWGTAREMHNWPTSWGLPNRLDATLTGT